MPRSAMTASIACQLVGRFLERERRRERLVHRSIDCDRESLRALRAAPGSSSSSAATSRTFSAALRFALLPLLAAERMQRRGFGAAPE